MLDFNLIFGELIAKCWEDEVFKQEFIANPEAKLQEAGAELEEGVTYQVIEAPKLVRYIVLPHENVIAGVQEMAKAFLHKAEESSAMIPEGGEVRIIQNTKDIRYLILPPSPKTLTAAELKLIAGGGSVATSHTQIVVTVSQIEVANYTAIVTAGVCVLI